MKTKEELNALKNEVEALNKKLAELSDEEMETVTGGTTPILPANVLPKGAYNEVFSDCPGLKSAPSLPAQTLQPSAYKSDDLPEGFK